jgi:uncharacterized protein (TIGR00369 family)
MSDTTASALSIPEGFEEMDPYGPFHVLVGPMYHRERDGRTVIGIRMTEKHRNKGQIVHGGMLMMLVDTAMTRACGKVRREDQMYATTNMNCELMAAAWPGDWLEAEVDVMRAGRQSIFLDCRVRRDGPEGQLVMHASGTFQVVMKK